MPATGSARPRLAFSMPRGELILYRPRALVHGAAEIDHQPPPSHRGMPAGGDQRAEMRALRRRLVDMERLRIEAGGERLDVVGGEGVAADLENVADADILEIFHGRASGSRRPNIAVVTMVVRQLPASSSTS